MTGHIVSRLHVCVFQSERRRDSTMMLLWFWGLRHVMLGNASVAFFV